MTVLSLFLFINRISAQAIEKNNNGISLSYWGNKGTSNGMQIGYEKYQLQSKKYKIIVGCNLLFEKRKQSYSSFGILASSGLRRTFKFGIFLEYNIKAGYLGSYYPFDFYKTNANGDIVNIGRKVVHSLAFGNSFGFGYDFSTKTKLNLQFLIKPNLYYRYPNNDNPFYLNNFALEAGVILHPKLIKIK